MRVVGFGGTTFCGRCVGGVWLLSVINNGCNVTGVLYTRIYNRSYGANCGRIYKSR